MSVGRQWRLALAALSFGGLLLAPGCSSGGSAQGEPARTPSSATPAVEPAGGSAVALTPRASAATPGLHHYEYVFPSGSMYVYDMDAGQKLVQHVELPLSRKVRGAVASPATHTLYVSYGGDGGQNGGGSVLAYDLVAGRVLWHREYGEGVDSLAISRDGSRLYLPNGELNESGIWHVLNAADGSVIGSIQGGAGAHNTVMGLSGRYVYLGGRSHNYLEVASTATNRVIRSIGPLRSGVRPFTINGRETLAYTTATGFLGFQVSSITSGRLLYTETFPGFTWNPATFAPSAPSHGISLSPNEREVWVIDVPNSYVHVFDVSRVPRAAPRLLANIRLPEPMTGEENGCSMDCARDGWIQHSRDGRFVYVGDAGAVIDAHSFRVLGSLSALRNTRTTLEIDWRGGVPVATTSRQGLGYVR